MGNQLMTAPVYADRIISQGRKNRAWFKDEVKETVRGKIRVDKLKESVSRGYVIFEHCEERQKRAIISAVDTVDTDKGKALVFVCHKCHMRIPVLDPLILERAD